MNTGGKAFQPFHQFPQVSPDFPTHFITGFTTLFSVGFSRSIEPVQRVRKAPYPVLSSLNFRPSRSNLAHLCPLC